MRLRTATALVVAAAVAVGAFVVSGRLTAQDATTSPSTTRAAPQASITPEAAGELAAVTAAYAKLSALELAGTLTLDSDVAGEQKRRSIDFTASFRAPNYWKHDARDDVSAGSTGAKLYAFLPKRNSFAVLDFAAPASATAPPAAATTASAAVDVPASATAPANVAAPDPVTKPSPAVAAALPPASPAGRVAPADFPSPLDRTLAPILEQQDPSLVLTLGGDAGGWGTRTLGSVVVKLADVADAGRTYTAVRFTDGATGVTTVWWIDPATHLLRRSAQDLAPLMSKQGAPDVKRAALTVDYAAVTPDAPQPAPAADAFAWSPPAGALDITSQLTSGPDAGAAAAELVGKPAPAFALKDLSGKDVTLADFKGRVVVIDFWATFCPPCVRDLPEIDAIAKRHEGEDLTVLAVNVGDDRPALDEFFKTLKVTVPVLLDADGKVYTESYKGEVLPLTIVVGRDGLVKLAQIGATDALDNIRKATEAALK